MLVILALGVWEAYEDGEFGRSYGGIMEQQWKKRLDADMNCCFYILNLPPDSFDNIDCRNRISDFSKEINLSPPSHLNFLKNGSKLSIYFFKSLNADAIATISKMADDTSSHDMFNEPFRISVNTKQAADSLNTFYHVKVINALFDTLTSQKTSTIMAFRLSFSSYLTMDSTMASVGNTLYDEQNNIYKILFKKNLPK